MKQYILSNLFLSVYESLNIKKKKKLKIKNYDELEDALKEYLIIILGYKIKHNYSMHSDEIKIYFENILLNTNNKKISMLEKIKEYGETYNNILKTHPLLQQFIEAMNLLYEDEYVNRDLLDKLNNNLIEDINFSIKNVYKNLIIIPSSKINKFHSIYINDIDTFESILGKYISAIKNSDSNYNIFKKNYYKFLSDQEKIRMIFQYTMHNATLEDVLDIETYFLQYYNFITKNTFDKIKIPKYICNINNDKVYVMYKNSEIESATPYYLSFMLKDSNLELPKIMLGIDYDNVAYILRVESSKFTLGEKNYEIINEFIRRVIPKEEYVKYYNPLDLISIILTLGIIKGLGIEKVIIKNEFLFSTEVKQKKIIKYKEKEYNEDIIKYVHLNKIMKGIEIIDNNKLELKLCEKVTSDSSDLFELYISGIEIGKKIL